MKILTGTLQVRLQQEILKSIIEFAERNNLVNDITNEPNVSLAVRELLKNAIRYEKIILEYKEDPEKLNDLVEKKQEEINKQTEEEWIRSLSYSKRSSLLKEMRDIQDEEYDKWDKKVGRVH